MSGPEYLWLTPQSNPELVGQQVLTDGGKTGRVVIDVFHDGSEALSIRLDGENADIACCLGHFRVLPTPLRLL